MWVWHAVAGSGRVITRWAVARAVRWRRQTNYSRRNGCCCGESCTQKQWCPTPLVLDDAELLRGSVGVCGITYMRNCENSRGDM
jgi:hypothetical protein